MDKIRTTISEHLVKPVCGEIHNIPGDKSISHRAVMLGALAENTSSYSNFLTALDCLDTLSHFKKMGVSATLDSEAKTLQIEGVGLKGLRKPTAVLDCGNAGTSMRLMSGILAGQPFEAQITGDVSIQKRPMKRIIDPLTQMGAKIEGRMLPGKSDIYPPLIFYPVDKLNPIRYTLPVASAQIKSAILLASLYSDQATEIIEPEVCRDHSEKMLQWYGADMSKRGNSILCSGKNSLKCPSPEPIRIPSDISSAAFFIVLAAVCKGSKVKLTGIGVNPTRDRICSVLKRMGTAITYTNVEDQAEPVADIEVEYRPIKNGIISRDDIPFLIDEIPILAVAALFGEGKFRVKDAKELRHKESDRIEAIGRMVTGIGGQFINNPDGFEVIPPARFQPFQLESNHDHRIAMSGIIAALASGVEAKIDDCACISTSFPNFFEILAELGLEVSRKKTKP